jgi:hypothetical protein
MTPDEARARTHELLGRAFAPDADPEKTMVMCYPEHGGEVYHTKLCRTVQAALVEHETALADANGVALVAMRANDKLTAELEAMREANAAAGQYDMRTLATVQAERDKLKAALVEHERSMALVDAAHVAAYAEMTRDLAAAVARADAAERERDEAHAGWDANRARAEAAEREKVETFRLLAAETRARMAERAAGLRSAAVYVRGCSFNFRPDAMADALEQLAAEASTVAPPAPETEVERLKALLHRDKTGLAKGLEDVLKRARAAGWIAEGRGSYEWDDDRYRQETGWLVRDVASIALAALKASGTLVNEAFHPRVAPPAERVTPATAEPDLAGDIATLKAQLREGFDWYALTPAFADALVQAVERVTPASDDAPTAEQLAHLRVGVHVASDASLYKNCRGDRHSMACNREVVRRWRVDHPVVPEASAERVTVPAGEASYERLREHADEGWRLANRRTRQWKDAERERDEAAASLADARAAVLEEVAAAFLAARRDNDSRTTCQVFARWLDDREASGTP